MFALLIPQPAEVAAPRVLNPRPIFTDHVIVRQRKKKNNSCVSEGRVLWVNSTRDSGFLCTVHRLCFQFSGRPSGAVTVVACSSISRRRAINRLLTLHTFIVPIRFIYHLSLTSIRYVRLTPVASCLSFFRAVAWIAETRIFRTQCHVIWWS